MKEAKLLGYFETKNHMAADRNSYRDHDEGDVTQHFVIELDGKNFEFTASESYGSCGSGYCSASWGDIENELKEINNLNELIKPIKDIFVNVYDNKVQTTEVDRKYRYDSMETGIKSTHGELIVSGTGNGGCGYYPSGTITLNENLFE